VAELGVDSVLGNRSCVGMVGGSVYCRGPIKGIAPCVKVVDLDKKDMDFLSLGMVKFLTEIGKKGLEDTLLNFNEWKKIVPLEPDQKQKKISVKDFRKKEWIKGGIFGDFIQDDYSVFPLATSGEGRLQKPLWDAKTCINCKLCINNCPQNAIAETDGVFSVDDEKCIGCSFCSTICPKSCWTMQDNKREIS